MVRLIHSGSGISCAYRVEDTRVTSLDYTLSVRDRGEDDVPFALRDATLTPEAAADVQSRRHEIVSGPTRTLRGVPARAPLPTTRTH